LKIHTNHINLKILTQELIFLEQIIRTGISLVNNTGEGGGEGAKSTMGNRKPLFCIP
jgi:hypothetical protein